MLPSISFTALAVALSLTFANAAPASVPRLAVRGFNGPTIENSYIVKLKKSANATSHINSLPFPFSAEDTNSPIKYWWPDFFKGYSGVFVGADLDAILDSPDVEYVEKNAIVRKADVQTSALWNLQAISTRDPVGGTDVNARIYTYSYDQPIGAGVDIYIVDTGVNIEHQEFQGRASFPWAAPGLQLVDRDGHGTHVAGIAAGVTYGVAKRANIISVKILDDSGNGSVEDTVDGFNWIVANIETTRRPSIVNASIGVVRRQAIDDAVLELIVDHGITVVAAAGNESEDAANSSPAHLEQVITVAASDISNEMTWFTNFGTAVDIFAPGEGITSAWITGATSTAVGWGTSLACPHVSGIAAYLLSVDPTLTPTQMAARIKSLATQNVITGVPDGTTADFAFNGVTP